MGVIFLSIYILRCTYTDKYCFVYYNTFLLFSIQELTKYSAMTRVLVFALLCLATCASAAQINVCIYEMYLIMSK